MLSAGVSGVVGVCDDSDETTGEGACASGRTSLQWRGWGRTGSWGVFGALSCASSSLGSWDRKKRRKNRGRSSYESRSTGCGSLGIPIETVYRRGGRVGVEVDEVLGNKRDGRSLMYLHRGTACDLERCARSDTHGRGGRTDSGKCPVRSVVGYVGGADGGDGQSTALIFD